VRSGPTERAVLVNCSGDTVALEPIVESGVALAEAAPTIGPYEVSILPLERATAPGPRIAVAADRSAETIVEGSDAPD
jgi:hypothetical protein